MSISIIEELLEEGYYPDDFGENIYFSGWEVGGKYESSESVIKVENSGLGVEDGYYSFYAKRSGSYFTDYFYLPYVVNKVIPKEVVITKTMWEVVSE